MHDFWTNTDNSLYRIYKNGAEERCDYAGIVHLTSDSDAGSHSPCAYCGQTIPATSSQCSGCGGPRLALVTTCQVQIRAYLPAGGNLMDLDMASVLEVKRKDWYLPQSTYFVDGGVSIRGRDWRPAEYQPWYPARVVNERTIETNKEPKGDQTIIRLSNFKLITMFIDSPVPLRSNDSSALEITMMLECKAEFFFGGH